MRTYGVINLAVNDTSTRFSEIALNESHMTNSLHVTAVVQWLEENVKRWKNQWQLITKETFYSMSLVVIKMREISYNILKYTLAHN